MIISLVISVERSNKKLDAVSVLEPATGMAEPEVATGKLVLAELIATFFRTRGPERPAISKTGKTKI